MSFLKQLRNKLPHRLQQSKIWEKTSAAGQKRLAVDKKLVLKKNQKKRIPKLRQLKYISKFFSARERLAILAAAVVGIFALGILTIFIYLGFVEAIPASGGSYREALVGTPIYINPVLAATNDVDLDLVHLLFSGLLRYDKDLNLQSDLAESWQINDDGTVYTVTLRENLGWHDDIPLTIDDVLFTYRIIQDPTINSPLQLSLQGVDINKKDHRTIEFTLEKAFTPFISILTVGILPQHLWSNIPAGNIRLAELNIKPIGSGPWEFKKLEKDKQGNIHSYTLVPSENYYDERPYLKELTLRFFPDVLTAIEAVNNKKVDGLSFIPHQHLEKIINSQRLTTYHLQLPQYTAIFLNPTKNADLKEKAVRQAIAYSIDRQRIIEQALDELGRIINDPILPGMTGFDAERAGFPYNPIEAQRLLEEAGWAPISSDQYIEMETERLLKEQLAAEVEEGDEAGESVDEEPIIVDTGNQAVFRKKDDQILKITLTTVRQPANEQALQLIKDSLQAVGFKVDFAVVDANVLINELLPNRDYQALIWGQILNIEPDLYTFWHSSQTEYPGLNLAGFSDKEADKLLVELRQTNDEAIQREKIAALQTVLDEELPAIFLYSPKYTYLLPNKIKGFAIDRISIPADRWSNINEWYIKTKRGFKK